MNLKSNNFFTFDVLNPTVKTMEYAVRGPLLVRAEELEKELEKGVDKPFTEIIKANMGDSQGMGQVPITFIRQVLALTTYPALFEDQNIPEDVKNRAHAILTACKGGTVGAYTDSCGTELIRKHVAQYIQKRDGGFYSDWQNIVLSAGASDGIRTLLKLFACEVDGRKAGVMIPIPQYPIYSCAITEFGLQQINYYLDESDGWSLNIAELQKSIDAARKICYPRVLVVINPGNPTGQVLSKQNIEKVIKFAYKERLFLLADEVYQDNIYAERCKFYSFKKVLMEMGDPYSNMELASFMSCSKGYMGECGSRGGYAEITNMCPKVRAMFLKYINCTACPSVLGQVCLDAIMQPPEENEPSYEKFMAEKKAVLDSLKLRAKMVVQAFNSIEGFTCNEVQGAMYAFPQIKLPSKAIEAAKKANQVPDVFYTLQLLESTGVFVVPGSGFGQQAGTYHFRTTILPRVYKLQTMLQKIKKFHKEFLDKYT